MTGFTVAIMFLLAFSIFAYKNFRTVVVAGPSMEPTFRNGQRVLVTDAYWLFGPIRHKDIVVVKERVKSGFFIKRVHKLPGEEVEWAVAPKFWRYRSDRKYVVPEGMVYVLGDNRAQSEDSREVGAVEMKKILGKVLVFR